MRRRLAASALARGRARRTRRRARGRPRHVPRLLRRRVWRGDRDGQRAVRIRAPDRAPPRGDRSARRLGQRRGHAITRAAEARGDRRGRRIRAGVRPCERRAPVAQGARPPRPRVGPEPRCHLRLHDEHGHGYPYEASESVFRLWEDMARREPGAVDAAMLRRAVSREAQHHLLYVADRAMRGDLRSAWRLLAAVRRHARLGTAVATFALSLPRTGFEQASRVFAQRTGRVVLYDPAPRVGPRVHELPQSSS